MNWKNELYNHEVTPPAEMWDRIAHDLDDEFYPFRNKLYHAEVVPPNDSWHRVKQQLDSEVNAVPGVFRYRKLVRIAAAAAIIGISFFTVNYFLTGSDAPAISERNEIPGTKTTETPTSQPPVKNDAGTENSLPESDKPLIASNTTSLRNARIRRQTTSVMEQTEERTALNLPSVSTVTDDNSALTDRYPLDHDASRHIRNLKGEIREDVRLMDLPNSYFLMTGPNGQSVRVSSKFRNTIQYLNGSDKEELLDVILRESQYWRSQFREWKDEVGRSAFIPSAQNFMDITALMQLLQQQNQK